MSISSTVLKKAVAFFMPALTTALLPAAMRYKEKQRMQKYEADLKLLIHVMSYTRDQAVEANPLPEVNAKLAESDASTMIYVGVGARLNSAIAHYEAGNQLECMRCIFLALGVVCSLLEMDRAAEYLAQQNEVLLRLTKKAA